MEYKTGDKIKIREDLIPGRIYGGLKLYGGKMADCRGKCYTIKSVRLYKAVTTEEVPFTFSIEMIEPVDEKNIIRKDKDNMEIKIATKDYNPGRYIKDYVIIVPNKVVEVLFKDGNTEKMVCHKEDTFDIRRCLFIALAKHLYKKEYTFEGIEYKANKMMMMKRYVKTVDAAIKNHVKDELIIQRQKEQELAKQESANKKHERLLAYKERCRKKEEERQIGIKKEAYLRAMREYDLEKKASKKK